MILMGILVVGILILAVIAHWRITMIDIDIRDQVRVQLDEAITASRMPRPDKVDLVLPSILEAGRERTVPVPYTNGYIAFDYAYGQRYDRHYAHLPLSQVVTALVDKLKLTYRPSGSTPEVFSVTKPSKEKK